ncbi:ABC transporter ATP-binding protein [Rothia sp. CCM 9417]|uniref:ABC transporter ATP-binding protein n=1 Tax=Rothia sp. CCM 9417 TaxID=3402657 RepID=UPI003ADAFFD5
MVKIQANDISKSYEVGDKSISVIEGFSYDFIPGKIYCVWGPSGSGKSTLLKVLGLLTEPSEGFVAYDGTPIVGSGGRSNYLKNKIGWVLQTNNLIENMSVVDNLRIGSPVKQSQQEIEKVLDDVGLLGSIDKDAKHLSGGESQRLAFARAILKKPEVLFIDEFTSGLDEGLEGRLVSLTREYVESGYTAIIASHSPAVKESADFTLEVKNNGS